jgi:hypothetical protein
MIINFDYTLYESSAEGKERVLYKMQMVFKKTCL